MKTPMPWDCEELRGWWIVGMNHYTMNGERRLFVAMVRDDHCIRAEGADEQAVWVELKASACSSAG